MIVFLELIFCRFHLFLDALRCKKIGKIAKLQNCQKLVKYSQIPMEIEFVMRSECHQKTKYNIEFSIFTIWKLTENVLKYNQQRA